MRKKLLLLLLLGVSLLVDAKSTALVVEQTDGKQSTFLLEDSPVITFSGEDCVFKSATAELSVSRNSLKDFHFTERPDAVEGVNASAVGIFAKIIAPSTILIKGVEASDVCVYGVSGQTEKADIRGSKESLTVSLANLPKGIYLVKFASYSLKLTNK